MNSYKSRESRALMWVSRSKCVCLWGITRRHTSVFTCDNCDMGGTLNSTSDWQMTVVTPRTITWLTPLAPWPTTGRARLTPVQNTHLRGMAQRNRVLAGILIASRMIQACWWWLIRKRSPPPHPLRIHPPQIWSFWSSKEPFPNITAGPSSQPLWRRTAKVKSVLLDNKQM